jgi:hypothetical protein
MFADHPAQPQIAVGVMVVREPRELVQWRSFAEKEEGSGERCGTPGQTPRCRRVIGTRIEQIIMNARTLITEKYPINP